MTVGKMTTMGTNGASSIVSMIPPFLRTMPLAMCGALGKVLGSNGLIPRPEAVPGVSPRAARRLAARFCAEVASDLAVVREQDAENLPWM